MSETPQIISLDKNCEQYTLGELLDMVEKFLRVDKKPHFVFVDFDVYTIIEIKEPASQMNSTAVISHTQIEIYTIDDNEGGDS